MALLKGKPKAAPRVRGRWTDRARDAVNAWPKLTLGTAAAVVGILGVLVPWLIAWEAQYQRVEQAKIEAAQIRSEMKQHSTADERALAWTRYGTTRTEALVLRNRLNDCAVQVAQGAKQTPLEIAVCRQYEDEWRDADTRAKEARLAAQATTKAGP